MSQSVSLYNTLTRQLENFLPLNHGYASLYACGPTVYDFAHIGNLRAFMLADLLNRVLVLNGFTTRYIMNLTDVGHLTDDADSGEDKIERSADREGKSARDIADFYIKHFLHDYTKMNFVRPLKFTRATDYIDAQIELVRELEKGGFTYKTSDGVYFDTSKYANYGELAGFNKEDLLEGARVEPNPEKKNPSDFALWKFSPSNSTRWQEWVSPWGTGFPGWHIECSAMSMKELGATIDIHTGGEDHISVHHTNEIAQSEAATGKKFVNYWLHTYFLQVDGKKMSKSLGNLYTLSDIESKGFEALSLRYLFLTAHYRSHLNFTWPSLQSADNALKKLFSIIEGFHFSEDAICDQSFLDLFLNAVNDDINTSKAVAIMWDLIKSELPESVKLVTLLKFDSVLGLGLETHVGLEVPQDIVNLARTRKEYRKAGIWDKADLIRREIEQLGYIVEDQGDNFKIKRKI